MNVGSLFSGMADDRSKALGWLADAGASVGTLSTFDPGLEARNV